MYDSAAEENDMKQQLILLLLTFSLVAAGAALAQTNTASPTKVTGPGTTTASGLTYWDIKVGTVVTAARG